MTGVIGRRTNSRQRLGRLWRWCARWIPRVILAIYCFGVAYELFGVITDFENYDRIVGMEMTCGMSFTYCSWTEFLADLEIQAIVCVVGLAVLRFLHGREREFALWQVTALIMMLGATSEAISHLE